MYALAEAGPNGFDDPQVLIFGIGGLIIFAIFATVELRIREPMIDMRLFSNRLFTAMNAVQIVGYSGLMGGLFLLPLLLQEEMGLSPFDSGLTTFPQAFGVVAMVQIAGRIYNNIGPRRMLLVGMFGVAATTLCFLLVDLNTNLWWIRLMMFSRGMAFACILIPMQTATYATMRPHEMGRASAIFNANRQVAASFGVALLATVLSNRLSAHDTLLGPPPLGNPEAALGAFHEAFLAAVVLTGLGAVASLFVSDKDAAVTVRPGEGAPVAASQGEQPAPIAGGH
jgi:predicted MFS family arabinose efflux permease